MECAFFAKAKKKLRSTASEIYVDPSCKTRGFRSTTFAPSTYLFFCFRCFLLPEEHISQARSIQLRTRNSFFHRQLCRTKSKKAGSRLLSLEKSCINVRIHTLRPPKFCGQRTIRTVSNFHRIQRRQNEQRPQTHSSQNWTFQSDGKWTQWNWVKLSEGPRFERRVWMNVDGVCVSLIEMHYRSCRRQARRAKIAIVAKLCMTTLSSTVLRWGFFSSREVYRAIYWKKTEMIYRFRTPCSSRDKWARSLRRTRNKCIGETRERFLA